MNLMSYPARYLAAELRAKTLRFARDEEASITIEALLVLPFLLWAFLATYTYFDMFRARGAALKANYAISDLLSRETNPINQSYLDGADDVFGFISRSKSYEWLRVSVVTCTADCAKATRTLALDWSNATDGRAAYTAANFNAQIGGAIPWIASGERVIIVESDLRYEPPFGEAFTGIEGMDFTDIVMTRPRFAPQLCWEGLGCANPT